MEDTRILNLKDGDVVELVGLPCLEPGTLRRINTTGDGLLFFFCRDGQHIIDGELIYSVRQEHCCITKVNL